jgi:Glycosyltransferase family 87
VSVLSGESNQQLRSRPEVKSPARRTLRTLAIAAFLLASVLIVTLPSHPQNKTYIEYWSSGKLLLHRADPYSPAGILSFEQTQGRSAAKPLIMLNPPWSLFLVAPLGLVSVRIGLILWTLAAVGCIFGYSQLLDLPSSDRAFAFVFAPFLACIFSGQSSPFLLLGFALFLRFYQSRPFLAGASLLLMAIKPHLFLIFWSVLLVDCFYRRRFRLLAGGISAITAGTAFSMSFDAHVWRHYLAMTRGYDVQQGFLPTASMLFRMLIDVHAFWLLFVPSALTILWGLWYYLSRRQMWDWRTHGMLLMLVTVCVSPYGFLTDEIVLLPPIAFALGLAQKRKYSAWILLAINTAALLILIVGHAALTSGAYIWLPFALLIWFLYATKLAATQNNSSPVHLPPMAVEKTPV